ncbi:uncharacterized protein FIESC28_04964 [Fusarium coffeatum]|uniref:Uncharacterized protein n=1 Tax=Fusarium coffeatum TaxID=231269 RepID=A0A366RWG3_9HYPO|nr:uncharacterized protein FIESC28_04964 [Fusarium coffeatum]RBR21427.1 hypothetical protein FIESC28_04964 [Fusarium coffeatum]
MILGSRDNLGCRFVDGNQEFLKLFGEDHIFKWLPAAIAHYERNEDPCFFIEINDDLPVGGEVASCKNTGDSLWTVSAKRPSKNALSLLLQEILELLKGHIKEVQDDDDSEDATVSERSTDCMSDGELFLITRTVTLKESGTLLIVLESTNTSYASLKPAFDEWASKPDIRVLPRDAKRALYYWSLEHSPTWKDFIPSVMEIDLEEWSWTEDVRDSELPDSKQHGTTTRGLLVTHLVIKMPAMRT